jgi:deoxyadenosine/deoxycytidine kinase
MIITIEGSIGAGKSTMLNLCKTLNLKKEHIIVLEDVDSWTSMKDNTGSSIFDLFYHDKEKYSYVFQTYVLFSRISKLVKTIDEHPDKIVICERSFMTDYEIFAKALYETGMISDIEWKVYTAWHEMARKLFNRPILGQIYLKTDPDVCYERIAKRNRQSEHLIDMKYLLELHKRHEDWLMNPDKNEIPTLVVDGNEDFTKVFAKEKISDFINSLAT